MIANYRKTTRTRWAGAMLLLAALACILLTNAYVAKADFTFGTPTNLGPTINSVADDAVANISADSFSLFFNSTRSGGSGGWDLMVATRETVSDPWGEPMNLGPTVNSSSHDGTPSISTDNLELYFSSNRPDGFGKDDIYVTTRATTEEGWSAPVNLGPKVNGSYVDWSPCISDDGLQLYIGSDRPGGSGGAADLWVTQRETTYDDWGEPVNLGATVNSPYLDASPRISADGLVLFFQSNRPGGYGGAVDIWVTRRKSRDADWEEPENLGLPVNSSYLDGTPGISTDGSTLFFTSNRPGGYGASDLWQVRILPIVDFNGDGNIDNIDLLMLVDSWGKNNPLYDIGPTPYGDGIVDIKDLEVFMSYWEKENIPEEPDEQQ